MRETAGYKEPKIPSACEGCSNLRKGSTAMSRPILGCLLERSAVIMQGPVDLVLHGSTRSSHAKPATAAWVARAFFEDDLDPEPGRDRGAIEFRDTASEANPDCPIIDRLISQLDGASPDDPADMTPPEPILPTDQFEPTGS